MPISESGTIGKLSEKAMLAELKVSAWAPRKFDRKATEELHSVNLADTHAGRYNKNLLPPKAMEGITSLISSVRKEHYRLTRPWSDNGPRILPSALFQEYTAKMRAHVNELAPLVTAFVADFARHKSEAKLLLGALYRPEDYPEDRELADKFSITFNILPLPDAKDFRVELSDDELEVVRADIEAQTRAALAHGQRAVFTQVADHLSHIVERLTAEPKRRETSAKADDANKDHAIFRDSLITNIRQLCETLPALNIEQDPRWDDMVNDLRALATVEPKALRTCANTRARTKRSADALLAKVRGYDQPTSI